MEILERILTLPSWWTVEGKGSSETTGSEREKNSTKPVLDVGQSTVNSKVKVNSQMTVVDHQ